MIVNREEVDFTLENFVQTTCLTRCMSYLLMKKLSDVLDSLTYDTDSENEFELRKAKRKFNTNQIGNDSCSSAIKILLLHIKRLLSLNLRGRRHLLDYPY